MANSLYSIFTETNTLKILGYLLESPRREFIEKEIQKATRISKGGVNSVLRELAQKRLVERKRRGRMYFYATYYSMFHSARALIYDKNYRERNHYCLIVALRALYVETKQLNFSLVEALQKAKTLREQADYYSEFSKTTASDLLESAKEFLNKAGEILKQSI